MNLTDLQIQYCMTEDGVRIAFFVMGEGPPLVHMPPFPLGHLQVEWRNPANRNYYRRLAQGHTLIRYDSRGAGLSDRDVTDYSQDAKLRDIEAVVDYLGLKTFALLGFGHTGSAAIAYAARNPERVSRLVLWHSYAKTSEVTNISRIEAARSLIQRDWKVYTELEGYRVSGWAGGRAARWYSNFVKESVTPEGLIAAYESISDVDVTEMLPLVQAPTLVMARRASEALPVDVARNLTAAIPNARLVPLDGTGVIPFPDVMEQFVGAVRVFLAETLASPAPAAPLAVPDPPPSVLTPRETEVLRLIAAGRSSSEISHQLTLSVRTVGRHITNLYAKIGARTRADATAYAIRQRLA
jgi:pimeloyl-ACP methyl ester carboxylesterase/DNA-binding CsgD family transcriptional regulator